MNNNCNTDISNQNYNKLKFSYVENLLFKTCMLHYSLIQPNTMRARGCKAGL